MTIDTLLYNTKVYFQGDLVAAGIAINDGKIVKIAKEPNLPKASEKINLDGNITLPGMIDVHTHLRDQKLAYKETFKTGTSAAAAGGVTTVIDMPNNDPVTMDSFTLKQRRKLAENKIFVNVGFNSAFPRNLSQIPEIISAGALGFKLYLTSELGGIDIDDDQSLLNAFQTINAHNAPILVHAEDRFIIESQKNRFKMNGKSDLISYLKSHSPQAEAKSINRIISIIKKSNISVHFCHLSSKLGLQIILLAKKNGLPITCEVTPHNLFLSIEDYKRMGTLALTDPPLRKKNDAKTLWAAVKSGFIDIVASDHAPHALCEKKSHSIWEVSPGVPGLETTLPVLLNQVNVGEISIQDIVRVVSENPAKLFHMHDRGFILENNWADLVVVDINREHFVDSSLFLSKSKYSPFDKMKLKGKPTMTFVNGVLVMDQGEIVSTNPPGNLLC